MFTVFDLACEKPLHSFDITHDPNHALRNAEDDYYVVSIIYLDSLSMFAVAGSDHTVMLLQELLASSGEHRAYRLMGEVVSHSLVISMVWAQSPRKLFTLGTAVGTQVGGASVTIAWEPV